MSGIVGSKFNHRGSGLVGSLGTDGQHLLSSGAGKKHVFETVAAAESYDDEPIKSDITVLALAEATTATSAAFNLPNSFIETFTDDTNLGTQTDGDRTSGFWGTGSLERHTITSGMLSQSGTSSFNATNLVDGDTGTSGFHTDYAGVGAYVKIDFGSGNEKDVTSFRFYVDTPGSTIWSIQHSTDDSTWVDAATGWVTDTSTGSNQWKEKTFTSAGAKRYWRFYKTSSSSGGGYHRELQTNSIGLDTASATGTLIQSANTVGSSKTKVGGTILYKDNEGTATLGSANDLAIYFTCDGGSNWTEAASYNAITPVYSSGVKMVRLGETTCTGGTDIRYKAVWANQSDGSKETQLHGIGINY